MASISTWRMVGCAWIGLTLGCGGDDPQDDGGAGPTTGDATTTGSESSSGGSSSSEGSSSGAVESTGALDTTDGASSESTSEGPAVQTGQCCFVNASCMVSTELECTEAAGNTWEAGYVCGICPDEQIGACCLDDGGCVDGFTVDKCGSSHAGPGTTCADVVCR